MKEVGARTHRVIRSEGWGSGWGNVRITSSLEASQ